MGFVRKGVEDVRRPSEQSPGAPQLMTPPLRHTLREYALGNYRVLTTLANELLTNAAQRELSELDEKLYFEVFAP